MFVPCSSDNSSTLHCKNCTSGFSEAPPASSALHLYIHWIISQFHRCIPAKSKIHISIPCDSKPTVISSVFDHCFTKDVQLTNPVWTIIFTVDWTSRVYKNIIIKYIHDPKTSNKKNEQIMNFRPLHGVSGRLPKQEHNSPPKRRVRLDWP